MHAACKGLKYMLTFMPAYALVGARIKFPRDSCRYWAFMQSEQMAQRWSLGCWPGKPKECGMKLADNYIGAAPSIISRSLAYVHLHRHSRSSHTEFPLLKP